MNATTPAIPWEQVHRDRLRRLAVGFVLLGTAWRLGVYLLRRPVWGDEAMLLLNYLESSGGATGIELRNCQVAPLLFNWAESLAVRNLGGSELAVRLLPLLVGLTSLVLMWRLASATVGPLAAALATGIFASSHSLVFNSVLAKPYVFDLFFSLLLVWLAVAWLQRPTSRARLLILILILPIALLGSYPVVFMAGAIGVVLLPAVRRDGRPATYLAWATYNLVLVAGFVATYLLIASRNLEVEYSMEGRSTFEAMRAYWAGHFPPASLANLALWLVDMHTGPMFAYPFGEKHGGSLLTVVLFILGVRQCWRCGRSSLVVMALGPMALGLIAAGAERYPYGVNRLSQHLAPLICLLAGVGASTLFEHVPLPRRTAVLRVAVAFLAVLVVTGFARCLYRPYREADALWARNLVRDLVARAGPEDPILVHGPRGKLTAVLEWQLSLQGARVVWSEEPRWQTVASESSILWTIRRCPDDLLTNEDAPDPVTARLRSANPNWSLLERRRCTFAPESANRPASRWDVAHWSSERMVRVGR